MFDGESTGRRLTYLPRWNRLALGDARSAESNVWPQSWNAFQWDKGRCRIDAISSDGWLVRSARLATKCVAFLNCACLTFQPFPMQNSLRSGQWCAKVSESSLGKSTSSPRSPTTAMPLPCSPWIRRIRSDSTASTVKNECARLATNWQRRCRLKKPTALLTSGGSFCAWSIWAFAYQVVLEGRLATYPLSEGVGSVCARAYTADIDPLTGARALPQHLHLYGGLYDELKLAGPVTLRSEEGCRRVLEAYLYRKRLTADRIGGGPASVLDPIEICGVVAAATAMDSARTTAGTCCTLQRAVEGETSGMAF